MAKPMTKEEIDAARSRLYAMMLQHVGPDRKIGMGELYQKVFGRPWHHRINDTRALRKLVGEMRAAGMPILSDSSGAGGYWISASSSELNAYCDKRKKAALKVLSQISRMKKVSLPEYLGQLQLELEARDEKSVG